MPIQNRLFSVYNGNKKKKRQQIIFHNIKIDISKF